MPRIIFIYMLLITLLITGCSYPTPEPLKTDLPSLDSEWTIKMVHSGGIMGLMRSIEISSDGKYTVMDERSNKTVTKKLSASELSKLQEIVSNTEYINTERSSPSGCADCFNYDLEIQKDGKKFSVHVDDISMPNSAMETLIMYLRDLLETALK